MIDFRTVEPASALRELHTLVAIDTVSPMGASSIDAVSRFMGPYGFEKAAGACWARRASDSSLWIYTHVDTKPATPRDAWLTDPLALTAIEDKLFGLGVSDSKFQLLNALNVFLQRGFNVIVDGGEEVGDTSASDELVRQGVTQLAIVDGAMPTMGVYSGLSGQIDGHIEFDSGEQPIHPGRACRHGAADWLTGLFAYATANQLHFNVTAISSEERERSLTMERVRVRFDLRYGRGDELRIGEFVKTYAPEIRQHYRPLQGTRGAVGSPRATFSSPLSLPQTLECVWVIPGGLPQNGNHRPNEWIFPWQIEAHRKWLLHFAQEVLEND